MSKVLKNEVIPIVQPHSVLVDATGHHVLVLNQDYQPLATAKIPRALSLLDRGKAEVLEHGVQPIHTPLCDIQRPSVIRLISYVKRPRPKVRFSRQNILKRDGWQCQYCGSRPSQLTLDHVVPTSRGGADTWENVITSCFKCNHKKGARTPVEAHMQLLKKPSEPLVSNYLHLLGVRPRPEWAPFLI